MDDAGRPTILCVDDEPAVLEGLTLTLGRRYRVLTAEGGETALAVLAREPGVATVISDMRMPGMNGAALLARVRELVPQATRLLLTGESDLQSAIAAVNEGQIFRFLSKPCPPKALTAAVEAAVEQHRLVTAERVLLEQTLHGSIRALTEVLSLTSPAAFGRATRLKEHVSALAKQLEVRDLWQVELAAMLSQLGCVTLPAETVEALYHGRPLNEAQRKMVERVPRVTEQLLASIPRLEGVRGILAGAAAPPSRSAAGAAAPSTPAPATPVEMGARILKVAEAFDVLGAKGNSPRAAIAAMRAHAYDYDPAVLAALAAIHAEDKVRVRVEEFRVYDLLVGMVLAEDLLLRNGTLFVARGYVVTQSFVERVRNLDPGTFKEPVRASLSEELTDRKVA